MAVAYSDICVRASFRLSS